MTAADDALVSRLQDIIDSDSRAVSEKYFEWIESTLSDTDWDAFEAALERGDFARAADLVHWDEFDIADEITATMNAASEAENARADLDGGICTIDEARARRGFPALDPKTRAILYEERRALRGVDVGA